MLSPVLLTLVLALQSGAPAKPALPDAARVKATVTQLEKAFDGGQAKDICAALRAGASVPDAAVVECIARGLEDKQAPAVRRASIEALRQIAHPKALESLLESAKRDRRLRKDEELYPLVLRGIGQYADPGTIAFFAEGALGTQPMKIERARIFALGNIRERASVEALLDLMKQLGPHKIGPYLQELSLALAILTGSEEGTLDGWQRWWNEHKKEFKVGPQLPQIAKFKLRLWREYWAAEDEPREKAKEGGPAPGGKGDAKGDRKEGAERSGSEPMRAGPRSGS